VCLAEASSLVCLDFKKSNFFPFKLDQRIFGLVLLVFWYFWFSGSFLVFWYFWYFFLVLLVSCTSDFMVLLVSWYFWFSGTSGTGEN
jgi:hypothetical protein